MDQKAFDSLQSVVAGRYALQKELGGGGMGLVYLATDLALRRDVAIKALRHSQSGDGGRERFVREALLMAKLSHGNIVQIYSVDSAADPPFLVMQYIIGTSLSRWAARHSPIPVSQVRDLLLQLARALHHAHTLEITHRDVKPDNVMVDDDGKPWLTDFGIAHKRGAVTLTETGLLVGSPHYMSPERWSGSRANFASSDQYALGIVAWECLVGSRPYVGSTPEELMYQHLTTTPPSPTTSRPDCPDHLAQAILRMMSKDVTQRYPSLLDVVTDLTNHSELRPVQLPLPCTPPEDSGTSIPTLSETDTPDSPVTPASHSSLRPRLARLQRLALFLPLVAFAGLGLIGQIAPHVLLSGILQAWGYLAFCWGAIIWLSKTRTVSELRESPKRALLLAPAITTASSAVNQPFIGESGAYALFSVLAVALLSFTLVGITVALVLWRQNRIAANYKWPL